jgi:preprotein translocase subunit SecE
MHEGVQTLAEKSKKPNAVRAFFRETAGELRKVSWPTWPEVWQLTWIVIIVMLIMGAILGLTDGGARELLNLILGLQ